MQPGIVWHNNANTLHHVARYQQLSHTRLKNALDTLSLILAVYQKKVIAD